MVSHLLKWSGVGMVVLALAAAPGHAQDRPAAKAGAPKGDAASPAPVNLNTASSAELQALPNVGPAMAARILEYRQKNGGFRKIEDLMNIQGIGEKSFLKLKPLVTVTTPKPADRW